jgi:hypothetical protein
MAPSDTLTSGLSGLQFSGLDNPYGLGATTLAASLPKLINPVGNVGTNLGIALGGTLLTALMGYQAQKTAADLTSRATQVGMDIFAAPNMEQRKAIADAADEGFYGPEVKSKALNLVNALAGQEQATKLAGELEYTKQLKQLEAQTSPAGEEYMGMQTDRLLAGIQGRGEQSRMTEAVKQKYKQENMMLQSDIKKDLIVLSNDEKLEYEKAKRLARTEAIKTGVDPDVLEFEVNKNFADIIDSRKQSRKQSDDLQKIEFKSRLDSFSKANSLSAPETRELDENTDVARDLYSIADYIQQNKDYTELQLGRRYSASDDESLKERLIMATGKIRKSMTGLAASKAEIKQWDDVVNGDYTGGVESIVDNLRMVGDRLNEKSLTIIGNKNKSPQDLYGVIANMYQTKKPFELASSVAKPARPEVPSPASASMPRGAIELNAAVDNVTSEMNLDEVVAAEQALITKFNNDEIDRASAKQQAAILKSARQRLTGQ